MIVILETKLSPSHHYESLLAQVRQNTAYPDQAIFVQCFSGLNRHKDPNTRSTMPQWSPVLCPVRNENVTHLWHVKFSFII